MLNSSGALLICDFFRRDIPGKSPMGGGHSWNVFLETISKHPLKMVVNTDITKADLLKRSQFNSV